MTVFQEASSAPASSGGSVPAAVSVGASASAADAASRKRSCARVPKVAAVKRIRKGPESARLATSHSPQSHSARIASPKAPFKWQIDKLMDWMKTNDYNSSPDWHAVDDLVESTRMKPSEVVAWAAELGGVVAKLRNAVANYHEASSIIVDSSIPELAEDEDAWNGRVPVPDDTSGPPTTKPRECPGEDIAIDFDSNSLEDLISEFGFELGPGDLGSCDNLHLYRPSDQMLDVAFGSSADGDLFSDFCLRLDPEVDNEEDLQLQRPSKRHCSN